MKKRKWRIWKESFYRLRHAFFFYIFSGILSFSVFSLYQINIEPFFYAEVLSGTLLLVLFFVTFFREKRNAKERLERLFNLNTSWEQPLEISTLQEQDYEDMIAYLGNRMEEMKTDFQAERNDLLDYYTNWVHQIKTPIAVMKLRITDETEDGKELLAQLFRIEQYVDMVLTYIRLESNTNDLLIQEYDLDELLREMIRKYAPQFILKKLKLVYEPISVKVVTDRKWFMAIVEQLLSNAVKYTKEGTVTIQVEDGKLMVTDTGIGIAKEDLPRIFEKGYTGVNGRLGEKSSGLGLYLLKKATDKLNLSVAVESEVGKGSSFSLLLPLNHRL